MPAKHTGQVAASPGNTEDLYNKWIASLWIKVGLYSLSWIPERKKKIKKKSHTFQDYLKDTNTNAKRKVEKTKHCDF